MLLVIVAWMCVEVAMGARAIQVSPTDFAAVLSGNSTWGPLLPGDVITFPGKASAPITYAHDAAIDAQLNGLEDQPIIIQGEELGGAIISETSGGNNFQIRNGAFFTIQKLRLVGGAVGIRVGSGPLVTDFCSDAVFQDLEVEDVSSNFVTVSSSAASNQLKVHQRLTFRRLNIHSPNLVTGPNRGIMLGAAPDRITGLETVRVTDSVVEYCWIHSLLPAAPTGGGIGVRVQAGSDNNQIRFNSFSDVGSGVILYDAFDRGKNVVYANFVSAARDVCYQATAGTEFSSNIGIDCGTNGMVHGKLGLMANAVPRDVSFLYNTILRALTACFVDLSSTATGVVIANNIFFCEKAIATNTLAQAGLSWGPNAFLGSNTPKLPDKALVLGGTTTSDFLENSGAAGDVSSCWPKATGAAGILGTADGSFVPLSINDFNCVARSNTPDVGCYETLKMAANPGWALKNNFRDVCAPPTTTTTTITTTTTEAASTTTDNATPIPNNGTSSGGGGGTLTTESTLSTISETTLESSTTDSTSSGESTTTATIDPSAPTFTTDPSAPTSTTDPSAPTTTTTTAAPFSSTTTTATATTALSTTILTTPVVNGLQPLVPCVMVAFRQTRIYVTVNLTQVYTTFDCGQFLTSFAPLCGPDIRSTDLEVHSTTPGSVIVQMSVPQLAALAALQASVRSGSTNGLPIACVTDAGGVRVCTAEALPWWIIIVAVCGGLLLVLLIIIAVVLMRKQMKKDKHRSDMYMFQAPEAKGVSYSTLSNADYSSRHKSANPDAYDNVAHGGLVTLIVRYAVTDQAPNVLQAKGGDIAFAEESDWTGTGPWLWCKIGNQEGWVPRNYCVLK